MFLLSAEIILKFAPEVGFEPTVLARQINSLLSLPVPLLRNSLYITLFSAGCQAEIISA